MSREVFLMADPVDESSAYLIPIGDDDPSGERSPEPPKSEPTNRGDGDILQIPIGIDLGTTNSSAAYRHPRTGEIKAVRLEASSSPYRLPSVVYYNQEQDRIVVGDAARNAMVARPASVKAEFKRDMPRASQVTYTLGDPSRGPVRTETPESLSAIVLSTIRERAERAISEDLGSPVEITEAVVTVPASFPEMGPAATEAAARAAGFTAIRLIDEPTAAALTYLQDADPQKMRILVFDWGGGTLDCSLLTTTGERERPFRVEHPTGDPALGGKDFDQAIVDILADRVAAASSKPAESGPFDVFSDGDIGISLGKRLQWRARLKEEAERIKERLSSETEVDFTIASPDLVDIGNTPLALHGMITRATFEEATGDLIARAMGVLRRTLDAAGVAGEELDRLVLVGGTTRMPAVETAIRAELGIGPYGGVDPLTAVAKGAALYSIVEPPPLFASHNFGVRTGFNVLHTLIRKNAPLPSPPVTHSFHPLHPGATAVVIPLVQFDDELVRRAAGEAVRLRPEDLDPPAPLAFDIGHLKVEGLTGNIRAVDVTFEMDASRILRVTVRRQSDGHIMHHTIDRENG
jgi:molecular chaperone DnaK